MKAMILAAGKGTRLGEITQSIPKALVDIDGKTALHYAAEKCTAHGFSDIIVNVHHFASMVEEEVAKLNQIGFNITVSDEREGLLETGGGLYKARWFFGSDPFLLVNVDIVSTIDYSDLYRFHIAKGGIASLAVRHRSGKRYFLTDEQGILRGWRNRATGEEILAGCNPQNLTEIAFSGIHIIDPMIFNHMYDGKYTMTDLYLRLAVSHEIFTYTDDSGYWGDIGTPESLEYIRSLVRGN
ncbi:MAG: nucleotidyltransferase family protein [Bacteroidales bacterium]|nr:nucleotidyltransferase family protein [Bacteroidales bacterium]